MFFTLFPADNIATGTRIEATWDQLGQVICHDPPAAREVPKKALGLWSPATFKDEHRSRSGVEFVYALGFDVDADPVPTEQAIRAALDGKVSCLVHSSSSSTPTAPRWRLLLELSRPVSADEYERLWSTVAGALPFAVGTEAKDPSRGWYMPRVPAEGDFVGFVLAGEPVPVDAVLASMPAGEPAAPSPAAPRAEAPSLAAPRRLAMAAALGAAWPPTGRHEAQLALAGALRSEGWSSEDALEFLCDVCRAAGDEDRSKREATCRHTWAQPEGAPLTGWTRLKNHVDPVVVDAARSALGRDAEWSERTNRRLAELGAASTTVAGPFPFTDSGNAERFAAQHAERVRFVADWNRWLTWDGARWEPDKTGAVARLAKETARAIGREAEGEDDDDRRKKVRAWASKSEGRQGRENMIALARSEQGIAAAPHDFDHDPWLLNVANGTLDLRTMTIRPHAREDMITKLAPVAYDPAATAPLWSTFLDRVMGGNAELIAYLQRLVGYALTGTIREQIFAFSFGDGQNGKGVFHHTIDRMLGEYSVTASDHLFFVSKGDGGHPTSTASLFGARFVLCSEIPEDKRFNEQLLKNMTGGDAIATRRLYENEWTYQPTGKLFFCGNHKPVIRGTDGGIWRRVRLIPWTVVIPNSEADPKLETKLEAELSGILAWAVRGCAAWRDHGLGEPPDVERATAGYREESDPLADFFRTRCEFGDGFKVTRAGLRRAYEAWCAEQGATPFGPKKVGEALRRRGVGDGGTIRDNGIPGADTWRGVQLVSA